MNRAELNKIIDEHFTDIMEISRVKGHDYAGDEDALANFKKQSEDWGITPEQVWGVFAGKHWSAVKTFVKEGDVASEPIEGRIHDVILYSFLLLGLIEDKKRQENPVRSIAGKQGSMWNLDLLIENASPLERDQLNSPDPNISSMTADKVGRRVLSEKSAADEQIEGPLLGGERV